MKLPMCEVIGCRRPAVWKHLLADNHEDYLCEQHYHLARLSAPGESERYIRLETPSLLSSHSRLPSSLQGGRSMPFSLHTAEDGPYYTPGQRVPAGTYQDLESGRKMEMQDQEPLPASLNGRVACYIRIDPTSWGQMQHQKRLS